MSDSPTEPQKTGAERRQHIRVAGPFDGRRMGIFPLEVKIYDLSEGGCFVNSVHEQQPGVTIALEIELPNGVITVKGHTLYTKPEFGYAVRFVDMTDALSMQIQRALRDMTG